MKRFLLAIATVVVLWAATFLIFFLTSKYRVEELSTYNAQGLGLEPPVLNDKSYERVMVHARREAHDEVKERVVWSLGRWGGDVAPRLVGEIDQPIDGARMVAAVEALAKMGSVHTLPVIRAALERPDTTRFYIIRLIDALADLGPEAGPMLVDTYLRYRSEEEIVPYNLVEAIGRSQGGTDFLIGLMDQAKTPDDILELQWALAFTCDERAARVLVSQLHHPALDVRRRARDSMAQLMGVESIEPATDLLEVETDDYVRSWIMQSILAKRAAADVPRVVNILGELHHYSPLAWEANYALARIGSDEAIGQLKSVIDHKPARWVMSNLEYSGDVALRVLEDYVHHEDRNVRRAAVLKILELGRVEAISVLEKARTDPDPYLRQLAETGLQQADLLLLEASAREWFSERTGRAVGRFRPPNRRGVRMGGTHGGSRSGHPIVGSVATCRNR